MRPEGLRPGPWRQRRLGRVGAFRAPPLRGLAARAPFFQDGKARDIKEVVEFYHHRFDLDLSGSERDDLVAFLSAL